MKIQNVIFATAISGMMALCSCSKEVMNDNRMEPDSRLTVFTRSSGENGDKAIATPVRIYVFDNEDQCVASQVQEEDNTSFSIELANGNYDVYAIGGASEDRLVIPTRENAEKTSVISLKEGKEFSDLMAGYSVITLTANSSNTLTLGMERKVFQIVSVVIKNVPEETEAVSVSISPLFESILLNGTCQGESGRYTIPLEKQADGSTWKVETDNIYQLPSVGKPTISVIIDESTYSYTCEKEMSANYKISIDGTYSGQGETPSITLSGTITGTAWAGENIIRFNFSEDSSETVNDDDNTNEVINAPVPEEGSLYEGCYVIAVNGKQATILSSIEKDNIITNTDVSSQRKQKINEALQNWSVPNITATWDLPDESIVDKLVIERDHITSPELGTKKYFFYTNSQLAAFSIKSDGTGYNRDAPTYAVHLRPVATLTFP